MTARTYTNFFDGEELSEIAEKVACLQLDWDDRRPHVTRRVREAGDARLAALQSAVELAREPVSEALY